MKSLVFSYNRLPEFVGLAEDLRFGIFVRAQRRLKRRNGCYRLLKFGYVALVLLLALPQFGFTNGAAGFQPFWFVAWLLGYLAFIMWGAYYLQAISIELARPDIRRMARLIRFKQRSITQT